MANDGNLAGAQSGEYRIYVGAPSLVTLHPIPGGLATTTSANSQFWWRPEGVPAETSTSPPPLFIPFAGPFAWLPREGYYVLRAQVNLSTGLGTFATITAQVEQNVTRDEYLGLVASPLCGANVFAGQNTLAAATTEALDITAHARFYKLRAAKVLNSGTNPGNLRVGGPGVAGANFVIAAGATFDLAPPLLGRGTLLAFSTLGTTYEYLIASW